MRPLRLRQIIWVTATTLLAGGGMVACSGESTPAPIGQGGSSGSTASGGSSGSGNGGSSGSTANGGTSNGGSSNGGTSSGGTSNGGTSNGGSSNGGSSNNNGGSAGDDPDAGPDSGTDPEPDAGTDPEPDAGNDPDPDPVNLVANFDVEAGTITPWTAAQGGTIAIATDQFNSGAQSAVTVGRDQTYEGVGVNLFGLVEHDKQYDASVFMRVSAPSSNVGRFTALATCDGAPSYRMITEAAVSDSAWTELSGTLDMWSEAECPNMTSVVLFVENANDDVEIYADDMVVIEQAE